MIDNSVGITFMVTSTTTVTNATTTSITAAAATSALAFTIIITAALVIFEPVVPATVSTGMSVTVTKGGAASAVRT